MNKDFLIGILGFSLIVVVSAVLIIAIFFIAPATSDTFKTMDFDGITVGVPDNSNFQADTNWHNDYINGIFIITHNDSDKKFINHAIESHITDNNLTEMHVENISSNIRTFIRESPTDTTFVAIVVNDNKDKAIIIETVDPGLALKIAKTVKF